MTKRLTINDTWTMAKSALKACQEHNETINKMATMQSEVWKEIGLNPEDYEEGSDKKLPIALYLLEADPDHDPIMRLVNAVITIRGGDTCHAAIFCREQGIPAVTAVGKVMLDGKLLNTGVGLTVDAKNGT